MKQRGPSSEGSRGLVAGKTSGSPRGWLGPGPGLHRPRSARPGRLAGAAENKAAPGPPALRRLPPSLPPRKELCRDPPYPVGGPLGQAPSPPSLGVPRRARRGQVEPWRPPWGTEGAEAELPPEAALAQSRRARASLVGRDGDPAVRPRGQERGRGGPGPLPAPLGDPVTWHLARPPCLAPGLPCAICTERGETAAGVVVRNGETRPVYRMPVRAKHEGDVFSPG